ncbi:BnaC04g56670D, partial [Brassica napus]
NSYIGAVHELSGILSSDFSKALSSVHKSLTEVSKTQLKTISNDTLDRLTELVESLKKEKHSYLFQLQGLGRTIQVLWKLMETPTDERRRFDKLSSLLSVQADDALGKGCLGLDIAEDEVKSLLTALLIVKMLIWVKVSCISADASKVYFTAGMKKRSIDAYEVIKPY